MVIEEIQNNYLRLNDYQAVTRHFPNSTFDSKQKSFIVLDFYGRPYENEQIQTNLANIISRIESRDYHKNLPREATITNQDHSKDQSKYDILEELAKELGIENSGKKDIIGNKLTSVVLPQQVKLEFPDKAQITLYPRGLVCPTCSYYILHEDLSKHKSLSCHACGKDILRQISNLFFCTRCSRQEEIIPNFKEPKDGPRFRCTEIDCNGHLNLKLERSLSHSRWICDKTGNKFRVIHSCPSCARWSGIKDPAYMKIVRTSESYMKPITFNTVYVSGNLEFSLKNANAAWMLSQAQSEIVDVLNEYGINDVQLIDDVESFTVVYGYASYGDEVRIKTFKRKNRDTGIFEYPGYTIMSKGKAILILLNKEKICEVILRDLLNETYDGLTRNTNETVKDHLKKLHEDPSTIYSWLAELTKNAMIKRTLTSSANTSLFKLLHSIEHVLVHQASLSTGLGESTFNGKVLVDDCSVLIYENSQVEAGGVEYLAHHLLDKWISGAVKHVRDCRYECSEGCVKCLYIQDPMCHPLLPREIPDTYMLPNSLLSRKLLVDFWGLSNIVTVLDRKSHLVDPNYTNDEEDD